MLSSFIKYKDKMSIHINKFVERLRGFEARGAKEFTMPINDAKDLHADITILLNELVELKETAVATPEVVEVRLNGGSFK
jgi:hypothetical protein